MGKKLLMGIMAVLFSVSFALPASAQVTLDDVLKRVEALEKENAMLKDQVMALKNAPAPVAAVAAAPAGNAVESKFKVKLYGYVKADAVYSNSGSGVSAMYPTSELATHDNDSFNMTAQETRLGLDITAPMMDMGGTPSAKIETDLWGGNLRIRHAYAKIAFDKWDVLAGQTWDFFSPLGPSTLNVGYAWNAGNIGDRHAQVILSNKISDNVLGGKLSTKVGILDTGIANQTTTGVPAGGVLVNYENEIMNIPTTMYVAGIIGGLESGSAPKYDERLYAGTTGMTMKFTNWLMLKGEGYIGSGLNVFRSATFDADGIEAATNKGIDSRGGFVELTLKPTKKIENNYGVGVDDVTSRLTSSATAWTRNAVVYTNVKYSLTSDLVVGVELQQFSARFSNGTKGDDNRIQTSLIYKF